MRIQFWGVRGSIPTPGENTVRFGGNTSCVSAAIGDSWIVFDAGTGIRNLGNHLRSLDPKPPVNIFLSHLHWDHIQGFPFFSPAYIPGFEITVYGRGKADANLGQILAGQMEGPNFPVSLGDLGAHMTYTDIAPSERVELPGLRGQASGAVTTCQGNHPNGVVIYRLDDLAAGTSMVYATDTEHFPDRMDARIGDLARGADILVYDGMYTPEDYRDKYRGWGHSTWEQGFELAEYAGVRKLVVFHHDPDHDDAFLEAYEKEVKTRCRSRNPEIQVVFAREKMVIEPTRP